MHIIYDPIYLEHEQIGLHPESPARLRGIKDFLRKNDLWENVISPSSASVENLALVHTMKYIETIRDFGEGPYDLDTYIHTKTYGIALKAAGGAMNAASIALNGGKAIALVRPPGHHATRNRAMGFCYFNNIAIATSVLRKRTAILDIDVHHGNGTNDLFYSNPDILYISTHQWGIFPGSGAVNETGEGDGEGFNVNIPLCAGSGDSTFERAFENIIIPIVREFRPELLLVSLGGDAHYRDPLASLFLSTPGYMRTAEHIFTLAQEFTNGGVAFMIEGGYDIAALSETVGGIVALSRGKEISCRFSEVRDKHAHGSMDIEGARRVQKEYWKLDG